MPQTLPVAAASVTSLSIEPPIQRNRTNTRPNDGCQVGAISCNFGGGQWREIVHLLSLMKMEMREIVTRIVKFYLRMTFAFFRALEAIGLKEDLAKLIVSIVVRIVGVCVDPFFLYIPVLSHTKMCLGMNKVLWKVAVALRTVPDFFTALILLPQLSRCMSSIKSILLMCVKLLVLAPISQILLSEMFILKTLGGYTSWNLILFCLYGARLVLIYEQLKGMVSDRRLVYLFLYFIVSHVIGASWYYLSIKRQLSCWNYDCKIITGCIFLCDDTTPSALNSTHVNEFCPINPPNAAVFNYGIYLDALQSGIVEDKGVLKKFLQCFFWGLRNLSSFASNLHTSTNDGEIVFAIIICALGLILLIYMVENTRVGVPGESRSANSVTGEFDSSSRTEEGGASVQRV